MRVKRARMRDWAAVAEERGWISGPRPQPPPPEGTQWLRRVAAAEQVQQRRAREIPFVADERNFCG
jgi:hypothetical protein